MRELLLLFAILILNCCIPPYCNLWLTFTTNPSSLGCHIITNRKWFQAFKNYKNSLISLTLRVRAIVKTFFGSYHSSKLCKRLLKMLSLFVQSFSQLGLGLRINQLGLIQKSWANLQQCFDRIWKYKLKFNIKNVYSKPNRLHVWASRLLRMAYLLPLTKWLLSRNSNPPLQWKKSLAFAIISDQWSQTFAELLTL